jgi:hypothetical protein
VTRQVLPGNAKTLPKMLLALLENAISTLADILCRDTGTFSATQRQGESEPAVGDPFLDPCQSK